MVLPAFLCVFTPWKVIITANVHELSDMVCAISLHIESTDSMIFIMIVSTVWYALPDNQAHFLWIEFTPLSPEFFPNSTNLCTFIVAPFPQHLLFKHKSWDIPPHHHHQSGNTVNSICNHPEAKHLGDKVGIFMLDLNPLNLIGLDLSGNWHHQWAGFLKPSEVYLHTVVLQVCRVNNYSCHWPVSSLDADNYWPTYQL